jgi:pyridoxamine 5'-phosphate oxidase
MKQDLENIRREYSGQVLKKKTMMSNPLDQFDFWLDEALETSILDPLAATLCTVNKAGVPSARIVLVKEIDETGFIFYTNYDSQKGQEIADTQIICLNFYWDQLHRQVRITGNIAKVSSEKSDSYFNSRPKDSQIMACVSQQSQKIETGEQLNEKFKLKQKDSETRPISRPINWGGFKITPQSFEFWQGQASRLHDRIVYSRSQSEWTLTRVQP